MAQESAMMLRVLIRVLILLCAACEGVNYVVVNEGAYGTPIADSGVSEQAAIQLTRYSANRSLIVATATLPSTAIPTATPTIVSRATEVTILGTGDVQVSLRWSTFADLDLHLIDPTGAEIYFADPRAASGGELDVDANFSPCQQTLVPVENIFFPTGLTPRGRYRVWVHYHPSCGDQGVSEYELTINRIGQPPLILTGTVRSPNEESDVTAFEF